MTIQAFHKWASNAELIAAAAALGHLDVEWRTLDPTYGLGIFWKKFRPHRLLAHDLDPTKAPDGPMDFTALAYSDRSFQAVVFDPPYKLNGTPDLATDERYGVHVPARWQDRMALCSDGLAEAARVTAPGGRVLMKCQDQVCSGKIRWQTDVFTAEAAALGLDKVDRLDLVGHGRPQPSDRRQVHAQGRPSTLLVFRKS